MGNILDMMLNYPNMLGGIMISKRFSVVSACNLCLDLITKFINKAEQKPKKNPDCKCKNCICS
jgi:hypothetical protein